MTAAPRIVTFAPGTGIRLRVPSLIRAALLGLLIGNLGRIPVLSTGAREAPILLNDLALAVVLGAGLLAMIRAGSLRLDRTALFALAFAGVGAMSTLDSIPRFGLNGFEVAVSLGYLARWLYYFAFYVVAINTLRQEDVEATWNALELVILAFAAFGIFQTIALPGFAQLVYPESRPRADWDPHGHRLVSTWLDPVFAGAFIAMGLLVQLGQIAGGVRIRAWKPLLLTAALLCSASRGAALAVIAGAVAIVLARGLSRRMLRATAGVLLLIVVAAPLVLRLTGLVEKLGVDQSALLRVAMWLRGIRVIGDHPLIGIGFNAWGFVQERYGYERLYAFSYSLDGGLLFIMVMTGVIGLAAYLAMLWTVTTNARSVWRDPDVTPARRGLAIGIVAATAGLVVDGLFGNSLFLPFLMEVAWLLWALVFVMRSGVRTKPPGHRRATT